MVMYQAECPVGKQVRRGVDVTCVFGAEGECCACEAVRGDVWKGGGEDAGFDGHEGPGGRGVVVGVVSSGGGDGYWAGDVPRETGEEGFAGHCLVMVVMSED